MVLDLPLSLYECTEYAPHPVMSVEKVSIEVMSKFDSWVVVMKLGLISSRVLVPEFHDRKLG